jgi:hypothetical protein
MVASRSNIGRDATSSFNHQVAGGRDMAEDIEDDDSGMQLDEPAEASTKTALLPTTFFAGKPLEPGTECKIRIERVLDGQAEVSYVPHESAPEDIEVPEGDDEMSGYMA